MDTNHQSSTVMHELLLGKGSNKKYSFWLDLWDELFTGHLNFQKNFNWVRLFHQDKQQIQFQQPV